MRDKFVLLGLLGTLLIAVGLAGTAYSDVAQTSSNATKEERHNPIHEQMHQMMDQMMGEGASHRMHEAMPGYEEMMELCTGMMLGNQTQGMMGNVSGMMGGGMGGMMGPGMMGNMMQGMMGR